MNSDFNDKTYRDAFVEANIRNGIAFQIRALRAKRGWSQGRLGAASGKTQNVISRLEDPSYGKFTIQTLLSLASAFDVALNIQFVAYSALIGRLNHVSNEDLAVPSFEEERNAPLKADASSLAELLEPRGSNRSSLIEGLKLNEQPPTGALAAAAPTMIPNYSKATLHETYLCSGR